MEITIDTLTRVLQSKSEGTFEISLKKFGILNLCVW